MDTIPEIITASDARESLYRLIDRAAEEHRPIVITGKRNKAVLVSEEDWNSMQETIYLYSVPGLVASIKEAAATPLEECIKGSPFDE
jgi:prevent-host-death family protein